MSATRIEDEGFRKHSQQLLDSMSSLHSIGSEFNNTIDGASGAWEGDAATKWNGFGQKVGESHEQMKRALDEVIQKMEGVAKASAAGQASQADAVSQVEASADWVSATDFGG
ncbi:WXG100 family type VII secretion target [Gordonia sp. (in: high G+C Gram-positive bacteria)]|uniref:WXG100 family type VII secretion target n=1 Tax=Gordonia sp. (in: high G+C Gram-positive bacteria) TaxID=84139 RepID=UPI0039E5C8ED